MDLFACNRETYIALLDVDQTSVLCNDTYNILLIVAEYTRAFTTGDRAALEKLAMMLVNPRMVEAIVELRRRTKRDIMVVFYTMKWKITEMMITQSAVSAIIANNTHVSFDPMPIDTGFTYLSQHAEEYDCTSSQIKQELDRVGLLTWAMSYMLGLPYAAGGFITSGKKDLKFVSSYFRVDQSHVYLFDDKAPEHIAGMDSTPYAYKHIVQVPDYNFVTMSKSKSDALEHHLTRHYPLAGFDSAYKGHYDSICNDPSWPSENWCITAACEWHLAKRRNDTTQPWDLSNVTFD